MIDARRIAVVIPCYRVGNRILDVLEGIGPEIDAIYVIDDGSPDHEGELVADSCRDPRVRVIRHEQNEGVGGATMTGYRAAAQDGMDVAGEIARDGHTD